MWDKVLSWMGGNFLGGVKDIIKEFHLSDADKLKLEMAMAQEEARISMAITAAASQNIVAEQQSNDKFTQRARPTFMYVFYLLLLGCMTGAIVGVWYPANVHQVAVNMGDLFNAIPEPLIWLFGSGYLGYTGARTWEKTKGAAK